MVILDTNIVIDHLRQTTSKTTMLMDLAEGVGVDNLGLSHISVQELYEGRSTREREKENLLLLTLSLFTQLPYTYDVAELAGKIARDLNESIEFADAAIAATCIHYDAELVTLNKKHFKGIKNLVLYSC